MELLRVQVDTARRDLEAERKRAAAMQVRHAEADWKGRRTGMGAGVGALHGAGVKKEVGT